MKLYLAILLPPLAVLLWRGRPVQIALNLLLTLLLWVPGIIHALLMGHARNAEEQSERTARFLETARPQRPPRRRLAA